MRVALLEVSHWHFPLYEPGLIKAGVEVVAVSDREPAVAQAVAARHGAAAFTDPLALIEAGGFDVAFVFGRHHEMPGIAARLIERGVPFSLEKPCGRTAAEVARLRRMAGARGLFVAVPLVQRLGGAGRLLSDLLGGDHVLSLSFRFIAGPPARYEAVGCGWMLDPEQSGGGAAINLAVHFIDLVHLLTRSGASSVYAQMNRRLHGRPVEDYALIAMKLRSGADALVEVGYGYPDVATKREFRFSIVSRNIYVETTANAVRIVPRTGEAPCEVAVDFDTDGYYERYVARVLDDLTAGRPPVAGLAEMEAAMEVIDAAYARGVESGPAEGLR